MTVVEVLRRLDALDGSTVSIEGRLRYEFEWQSISPARATKKTRLFRRRIKGRWRTYVEAGASGSTAPGAQRALEADLRSSTASTCASWDGYANRGRGTMDAGISPGGLLA